MPSWTTHLVTLLGCLIKDTYNVYNNYFKNKGKEKDFVEIKLIDGIIIIVTWNETIRIKQKYFARI